MRPGEYTLVAEHQGYETLRVPLEVARDGKRQFRFSLKMLPGRLRIDLPAPGEISIDGKPAGKAPGEFKLAAGTHKVLIDTERYLDFATDVVIEGKDVLQALAPKLVPGWAKVSISSEPSGAETLVGGEPRGTTPVELELMGGNHRLELRRPGFKTWVSDIQVKANEPMVVGPVRLGIPDGRLAVRSSPSGANVTIGGAFRGRTPLDVDVRPDVVQAVSVSREGYESAGRDVTIASGARQQIELTLKPILGDVIVRATPADAELFVDGRSRGAANQTLRLPATAHAIEIRKPGYVTHKATVTPRSGLPQNLEVDPARRRRRAGTGGDRCDRRGSACERCRGAAGHGRARPDAANPHRAGAQAPARSQLHHGKSAARGRTSRQRGAAAGRPAASLLRFDARSHERRLQEVPCGAPLRVRRPEHAGTRASAGGQCELAGRRGVLQLAFRGGRADTRLREAG